VDSFFTLPSMERSGRAIAEASDGDFAMCMIKKQRAASNTLNLSAI
jgi:hypothetical protein